jgi:hypothetical protein
MINYLSFNGVEPLGEDSDAGPYEPGTRVRALRLLNPPDSPASAPRGYWVGGMRTGRE